MNGMGMKRKRRVTGLQSDVGLMILDIRIIITGKREEDDTC